VSLLLLDSVRVEKAKVERKAWGDIFKAINPKVAALTNSVRKDKYMEMMVHLNNVKDAWRNPTMHSRRRYTQDEAEDVFGTVRSFMQFLAK